MGEPLRVLSLGAGVQSSTLALMAAAGEVEQPEFAVFADTQAEPPTVYDWLDWLEVQLPFPVKRVSAGSLVDHSLKLRRSKTSGRIYQKTGVPLWVQSPDDGSVGPLMRKCTTDFKIIPIVRCLRAAAKANGKTQPVEQHIGISLDEAHRMKPAREKWITTRWPLVEMRMTRHDCLKWWEKRDLPRPPRSACVFCPYHSDVEWLRLQTEEPASFQWAVDYERAFQAASEKSEVVRGIPYLHRSCKPINQVDFDPNRDQIDMFGNECEGMCGV